MVRFGHNVVRGVDAEELAENLDKFWKEENRLISPDTDFMVVSRRVESGTDDRGVFIIFQTATEYVGH